MGGAGWALAHPEFGSSVNPITTRGADNAHHITASQPGFQNPAASLCHLYYDQWVNRIHFQILFGQSLSIYRFFLFTSLLLLMEIKLEDTLIHT